MIKLFNPTRVRLVLNFGVVRKSGARLRREAVELLENGRLHRRLRAIGSRAEHRATESCR